MGNGQIRVHTDKAGLTKIPLCERMTETGGYGQSEGRGWGHVVLA